EPDLTPPGQATAGAPTTNSDSAAALAAIASMTQPVLIQSSPSGADVWVDGAGVSAGKTPLLKSLPPGRHTFHFAAHGFKATSQTVEISEHTRFQTCPITALSPATVSIHVTTSPPDASVCIDGRRTYLTPATIDVSTSQPVNIEVRRAGYESIERIVTANPGRETELHFSLVPTEASRVAEPASPTPQASHQQSPTASCAIGVSAATSRTAFIPYVKAHSGQHQLNVTLREVLEPARIHADPVQVAARLAPFSDEPRIQFTHGLLARLNHSPEHAQRHLMVSINSGHRTGAIWFAPYRLLIRGLLEQGKYQEAWHWTRQLIHAVLGSRQRVTDFQFAAALTENLQFAGSVAGFLEGPHRNGISTQLRMNAETNELLAQIPHEFASRFHNAKRDVKVKHQEFVAAERLALANWEREVERKKDSGEIPRTELKLNFGAGQYRGALRDTYSSSGGIGYGYRYNSETLQHYHKKQLSRSTTVTSYDLPERHVSRKSLSFAQYLPWDWYTERDRLLRTFEVREDVLHALKL
ncbi:MAG: PEGA domain-containing protein, partial [Planctomycetota bacterium]|nr:PEGA domain-containing protein [Planctomycetota bacterium]